MQLKQLLPFLLLAAALARPIHARAQDQTSGDDARPMTQRQCDQSPGSCDDMTRRHEHCQKFPTSCQGAKSAESQAHDRAAAAASNARYRAPPRPDNKACRRHPETCAH